MYDEEMVERVKKIQEMKEKRMTLDEIRSANT
jgi:DNA-binding transcriptional MerR regulator